MKQILWTICFACLSILSKAQDTKLRVAVLDPTTSGIAMDDGTKLAVQELISSTFVNTGRYIIIERSMIDKIIKEQSFQNSDMADNSQATEIGKLAGANKVVLSAVSMVGGRNMLSIKVIDVTTASIDKQRTKIVGSNDLLDAVEPLTLELLGEAAVYVKQNTVFVNDEENQPLQITNKKNQNNSDVVKETPKSQIIEMGQLMTFEDGSKGIVFYKDGEHGIVVSLDANSCSWQNPAKSRDIVDIMEIPNNKNDDRYFSAGRGVLFTASIMSQARLGNALSFPAASWCVNHGTGWYLPSAGELVHLFKVANRNGEINDALIRAGGIPLDRGWHWSSSEIDKKEAINVSSRGWASGEEKTSSVSVRAFRTF